MGNQIIIDIDELLDGMYNEFYGESSQEESDNNNSTVGGNDE